jgi:hypothetical protein
VNNGRIRAFTSRNDEAHNSNVVSIPAYAIHLPPNNPKVRSGILEKMQL